MEALTFNNIAGFNSELKESLNVLYGAGGNGERIFKILDENAISINYFCDDDYNKWGTKFCGVSVISFDKLMELSKEMTVRVILTSVFAGPLLSKLEDINVTIYEPFSMLIDRYYKNSFYKVQLSEKEKKNILRRIEKISYKFNDKKSIEILKKISQVVEAPDEMEHSHFFDVASKEDCYFVKEVLEILPEKTVIVDCGGFTGDIMVALERHKVDYNRVYSFEVNQELIKIMKENIARNLMEDKFIPIEKGVWNSTGFAYLNVDVDDIAGGSIDDKHGVMIETITIDEYFQDIKIDFIKMDIEGAELNALKGGINVIKNNRPIMAISLYHSIYDVVEIPLYLMDELKDYYYMIRHHSFIDSETVLYCIPFEKRK